MADRIVIVTGGSQNIGLAISRAFITTGATVISADLNPPNQDEAGLKFIETDVADQSSVQNLMAAVEQDYGRLDVPVNNAGICIEKSLTEMSLEEYEKTMAVNVRSVFLCCKHANQLLRKSAPAAIVNISSIEGLAANPLHAAYAASKGAVASMTHNIALEFGPQGIRCNAIAPGWINTPFNENLLNQYPDRDEVDAQITALHPVGRLGTPEDIANTAVFLASEQAAFISGQELVVDGGRLAKLPTPAL